MSFTRQLVGVLAVSAVLLFAPLHGAQAAGGKFASIVIAADSGRVLYARNAEARRYPASLTKIMTLYLTFQALEQGRLKLTDRIRVSGRAARQPPSKFGLSKGQTIRVKDAILGLVTKSANDVAVALAEHIAGTERRFAARMTKQAHRLAMHRTTFRNASGLPHRQQRSTAHDMARLGRAIIRDFPQYYGFFSRQSFRYKGLTHRNHNNLLGRYRGVDGIKTGYIHASGFNLVASVTRDGHRLIGVVFGGRTAGRRDRHMAKIIDRGFTLLARRAVRSVPPLPGFKPRPVVRTAASSQAVKQSWKVQVGAYYSYSKAMASAEAAAAMVARTLAYDGVSIVPVVSSSKRLHRAQLTTPDRKHAKSVCRALRRQKMECITLAPKRKQAALTTSRG